eukprot:COSAG02_NODE_20040_length_851_cov_0.703457_2_plen_169_part_01
MLHTSRERPRAARRRATTPTRGRGAGSRAMRGGDGQYIAFPMALTVGLLAASTQGAGRWAVPVGWDAITHGLETWPQQRLGVRAMVRSTFDRAGGNEAADSSHYLYINNSRAVAMSLEGTRGCLYFCRFNHWHGSPWNFAVDGVIHTVEETNTAAPGRANLSVTSKILP